MPARKRSSMRVVLYLLFALFILSFCGNSRIVSEGRNVINVLPDSDSIRYIGRIKHDGDSVTLYWSATNITFRFRGTGVKALLKDELGKNYFNVVIDGDSVRYFKSESTKQYHILAENLKEGEHTIQLIKRNEWDRGKTWFYGLQLNGTLITLPEKNQKVIEFFGDSITAGYAIDDTTAKDSPEGIFTNNYPTYAAITARHFNADLYCTVKSGIGIMLSWFPLTMPELYNRLDPKDSLSRWDFSKVQPNVVVINIFQNDSWLVKLKDHPSFKRAFGKQAPDRKIIIESYKNFVKCIRAVYPNASIICALGSMEATKEGSPWPGYIEEAVSLMNDKNIYIHFFPYTKKPGHPRRDDNQAMAMSLIGFITKNKLL